MSVLYIFIDETGDIDFRPSTSKYLIWGALTIIDNPHPLYTPLSQLKHKLNTDGEDLDRFHAAEEKQWIRNEVYDILSNPKILFENDFVIVEKRKVHPSIRDLRKLYPKMASYLLRSISNRHTIKDKMVIFIDLFPKGKQREAVKKTIKEDIPRLFKGKELHIYHHSSRSNFGLQGVDYCAWAIQRKWNRKDLRSYIHVERRTKNEFPIFQAVSTVYY